MLDVKKEIQYLMCDVKSRSDHMVICKNADFIYEKIGRVPEISLSMAFNYAYKEGDREWMFDILKTVDRLRARESGEGV